MLKKIAFGALGLVFIASPLFASADQLSDLQVQLQSLLAQLTQLRAQLNTTTNTAVSIATNAPQALCISLVNSLSVDDTDADNGGEVTKLQQFLASLGSSIYPEARITGYFGPATLRAVQRWQAAHGVVSSGDPDTTGYGFVGARTRAALAQGCGSTNSSTQVNATPATTQAAQPTTPTPSYSYPTPTYPSTAPSTENTAAATTIQVTYPQAGNSLENSGEKSSGQIATIQWNEQNGNYPVNIWLLDKNGQIIKGLGYSVPDTGSYSWGYDPSLTDDTYKIEIDVMYSSGTGGQDRAYSGFFTISQSPLSSVPTISNFSASATTISSGQPVTLSWSSNAANCSVWREDIGSSTNIAPNVGSATTLSVSPAVTTTYTLHCYTAAALASTGKSGPDASQSLTISVPNPAPSCTITATSATPSPSGFGAGYYYVMPNSNVTLSWTSQYADYSVWSSGDKDNPSGSHTFSNLTNITNPYSLTFYGSGGTTTCSINVYVDYKG